MADAPNTSKSPESNTAPTEQPAPALPSVDDIIASISPDKLRTMSDGDIDKLIAGDSATISHYLPERTQDEPPAPPAPSAPINEGTPTEIKRISLRGMDAATQKQVADIISAVKGGKSLADVLAQMSPAPSSPLAEPLKGDAPPSPPEPTEVAEVEDAEVEEMKEKVAALIEQRNAARAEYRDDERDELTDQIAEARLELREAKRRAESRKSEVKTWAENESASRDKAEEKYDAVIDDPAFQRALKAERLLAEAEGDPVMMSPDWPMQLCDRVHQQLYGKGTRPASQPLQRPIPPQVDSRPKGAVSAPSGASLAMSEREVLEALEKGVTLEEVDQMMDIAHAASRRHAA